MIIDLFGFIFKPFGAPGIQSWSQECPLNLRNCSWHDHVHLSHFLTYRRVSNIKFYVLCVRNRMEGYFSLKDNIIDILGFRNIFYGSGSSLMDITHNLNIRSVIYFLNSLYTIYGVLIKIDDVPNIFFLVCIFFNIPWKCAYEYMHVPKILLILGNQYQPIREFWKDLT